MAAPRGKTLWQGRFLRAVDVGGWECIERVNVQGIVAIVPVTDDGKLVLVEQYRPPVGCRAIEIPAGLAGDTAQARGEALEQAARRELLEETGYEADTMTYLLDGANSPGMSNEVAAMFYARGLRKTSAGGGDGSENIVVHEVPLAELYPRLAQWRRQGLVVDFKIFAGLELARQAGAIL